MEWKVVLQLIGVALGLLYLWLEYRVHIGLWLVGILMPLVHGVLYLRTGLYADAAMNGYYIVAGLYGWMVWRQGRRKERVQPIASVAPRLAVVLAAVAAALWGVLYLTLEYATDSTVPVLDSLTTALSVVALWMLSRKLLEQWIVWLVIDALTFGLYLYKGLPWTAGLYALYTVLAVVGYLRWKQLMLGTSGAAT